MKSITLIRCVFVAAILTGCAIWPSWHWDRPGANEEDLSWDQNQCKAKTYSGSAGIVTNETVRRMEACMTAKGWRKVAN